MNIQYLLFDLDETLYTGASGLFQEVGVRIEAWLMRMLNLSLEEAHTLRRKYYIDYGTTLGGLWRHHPELDIDDYLDDVHKVDVTGYLSPKPELDAMLTRLPVPKVIFTNGVAAWADRVLTQLGVRHHFPYVIDVRNTGYRGKPYPTAYQRALELLGAPGPACVFIEDQVRNLQGAAAFGMRTLLVRPGSQVGDGVEFAVDHVLEIEPVILGLLNG
ncbi:MAG: pyrimidine 5'-nucleotidase [Anaerolineae bacterium]|nr:pyrimidine 5'-nucleotidase [Anaerolineae bacterium]